MKFLSIIRHAKTEPSDSFDGDFERVLTKRGIKDAGRLGKLLKKWDPPVDWLISSPAIRARTTTELIAQELNFTLEPTAWHAELYASDPATVLKILAQSPVNSEHVALIAHNPELEQVAAALCASGSAYVNLGLSPGSIAHFSLEISRWDQIRKGCGRLEFHIHPKVLKAMS